MLPRDLVSNTAPLVQIETNVYVDSTLINLQSRATAFGMTSKLW